jgi:FtsZ-interacting cell division protein ZipA
MSDLQIALIGLGVLLVVAVWFYNLWQEKKQRQRAEQMLPATASDVLMAGKQTLSGEKTEPGIAVPASAPETAPPTALQEPGFMDPDLPLEPETQALSGSTEVDFLLDVEDEGRPVVPVPDEWGDGRADCLLRMEFVTAVPVHVLWEEHRDWSSRIDKPIQWLGLDDKSGRWRTLLPQDAGSVSQVAVALQLVDRLGAVSETTLAAFLDGTSRLAQRFVGLVETPVLATVLTQAQELDAFCASVDLQLSLHVLPEMATQMSGALLKPLIDAGGLKLEGERYVALNDAGAEAYALICRSATSFPAERVESMDLVDLIFSLDVPRVAAGAQVFDRMIAFARQCASALGGQLADAHRKPLPDATIATIRGRIDELQHRMAERGLPAGSVRALRLFS